MTLFIIPVKHPLSELCSLYPFGRSLFDPSPSLQCRQAVRAAETGGFASRYPPHQAVAFRRRAQLQQQREGGGRSASGGEREWQARLVFSQFHRPGQRTRHALIRRIRKLRIKGCLLLPCNAHFHQGQLAMHTGVREQGAGFISSRLPVPLPISPPISNSTLQTVQSTVQNSTLHGHLHGLLEMA